METKKIRRKGGAQKFEIGQKVLTKYGYGIIQEFLPELKEAFGITYNVIINRVRISCAPEWIRKVKKPRPKIRRFDIKVPTALIEDVKTENLFYVLSEVLGIKDAYYKVIETKAFETGVFGIYSHVIIIVEKLQNWESYHK